MRIPVRSAVGAILCLATLLPGGRAAEEAVLPAGRRLPGALAFVGGRLHFQPAGSQTPLPLAGLHAVRFTPGPLPPLLAGRVHGVLLPDDQSLTGQLLGLDDRRLRLRTAWADDLAVPRLAVAAVTQLPGWDTFFAPEFAPDLGGWQATGAPALGEEHSPAGQHCLILDRAGQAVSHDLSQPVAAGWFAIDFQTAGTTSGARWVVEAEFRGRGEARTVRAVVAGDGESYEAEVPGLAGTSFRLARTPGWHRLRLDFGPDRLALTVDDNAFWSAEGRGPGGPLRQVRLACVEVPGAAARRGAVAFADVSLARPLAETRHPPGDPDQDELWLTSGDQLFGQVPRADGRGVELVALFGKETLPWGEVRGLFPRHGPVAPPTPEDGEQVRVWLAPGAGEQHDELVGTVRGLDERRLTLDHPLLGECKIDRGRLRQLRGLPSGRR